MYLKILPPPNARGSHFLRIPASKTAAMRIILETVQRGSRFYTSGIVAAHKAVALADKFSELYEVDANSNRRAYRKRQGFANNTLIMYPHDDKPGYFLWSCWSHRERDWCINASSCLMRTKSGNAYLGRNSTSSYDYKR